MRSYCLPAIEQDHSFPCCSHSLRSLCSFVVNPLLRTSKFHFNRERLHDLDLNLINTSYISMALPLFICGLTEAGIFMTLLFAQLFQTWETISIAWNRHYWHSIQFVILLFILSTLMLRLQLTLNSRADPNAPNASLLQSIGWITKSFRPCLVLKFSEFFIDICRLAGWSSFHPN